jgi:hypothetical protein
MVETGEPYMDTSTMCGRDMSSKAYETYQKAFLEIDAAGDKAKGILKQLESPKDFLYRYYLRLRLITMFRVRQCTNVV